MPKTVKHGWTHRPRSEGGTDPIEFPTGGVTWAVASASQTAVADAGSWYQFTFDFLRSNSATVFQAVNVTAGRADWIQINEGGYYIMKCSIRKSGVFSNAQYTRADPIFQFGGAVANIQTNLAAQDFLGIYFNRTNEQLVGETAHAGLYTEVAFHYDPVSGTSSIDSENPLKVGCALGLVGGAASITMECSVLFQRIADAGFETLDPA